MKRLHPLPLLLVAWHTAVSPAGAEFPRYSVARTADLYNLPLGTNLMAVPDEAGLVAFSGHEYKMSVSVGTGSLQPVEAPTGLRGVLPVPQSVPGGGRFAVTGFDGAAPAIPSWSTVNTTLRYTPGLGYENLGGLNGGNMMVRAMSPNGIVAANALDSLDDEFYAARYRDGEGWRALGALGPLGYSLARAVNDAGVVVGESTDATNSFIPFFYTDAGGMQAITNNGEAVYGRATAINNRGLVTGNADDRVFIFNTETLEFRYITGPAQRIRAVDINDAGAILGVSGFGSVSFVTLYREDFGLVSLSSLLEGNEDPSNPTWLMKDAADINDNGWILGTAQRVSDNTFHQVLLRPVPEPGAVSLLLGAILAMLGRRRKR